ncbi:hypothetical protein QWY87_14535 [Lutimonas halocynthiae]|uniref:ATP-binding protein n=1 Tax=Lutimonas halocynthiae TaxID=1446477 RepID=UPI0025B4FCAF|nr:tetratricopeptide repeat-containing sensor histidine kinase [Lutimonas halocynthiae]MDN3643931.1 hypothetical protein [Lutimonas halocynthiae]
MHHFLKLNLLLLCILCVACQNEPKLENKKEVLGFNEKFNDAYVQSKDTSFDHMSKLRAANRAYGLANKQDSDSLLILALHRKTLLHNKLKQRDSAILYSKELLSIVENINDSVGIGKAYWKLGYYNDLASLKDSAYYFYNQSKKIHEALKDSAQAGRTLLNMAILLSDAGSYTQSDEIAIEGLTFLQNTNEEVSKASILNCIAINGKKQNQFEESLYWYKLAIETTNNIKHRNIYLNNIANIKRIKGEFIEAIRLYEQIIAEPAIVNDTKEYARILDNLSYTQWLFNKNESSLIGMKKALLLREEANNNSGQITSHEHLTEYYLETDLAKAREHANKMHDLTLKSDDVDDQLGALDLLMRSYENQPTIYSSYAKAYMSLSDSIQQVRNKLSNKYAKIRFDATQNRAENEMLRTRSAEEQLALEKSKRMNSVYIAIGVISIFVFAFILLLSRERYQKEKLQEVVLTESRISKKVHDEVANDLYQVMTKLEKQPTERDALLNDLDSIYNKTRDISRENNALDLEQDFGELLSDLLMSYKSDEVNIITKGLKKVSWKKTNSLKKTAIFRVIQELMTNMKKHSEAQIVILSFDEVKNKILIKYSDDGVGCQLKKNNGLLNAENRITSLRGKITLQSEKGKGFKTTIII